jgi:hypothetical protein
MFNEADNRALVERINRLTPGASAEWGKMDPAHMMAHVKEPLKVAFGELKLKRSLMGMIFGSYAKKKFTRGEPFKRNMPTDKRFVFTGAKNFEEERKGLVALVQRFAQAGPNGISKEAHPFFGPMTPQEWDSLCWTHLDHHLRQFGA